MSVRQLNESLFSELAEQSRISPRKRSHYNFHHSAQDSVQRVLIALQPDSYVAVHRHPEDWKWEMLLLLRGELDCLIFNQAGEVLERYNLTPQHSATGVQLPAGCWHSIICKQPNTMLLEIKPGPYEPATAALMADWCPLEGEVGAAHCHAWMRSAEVGDKFARN